MGMWSALLIVYLGFTIIVFTIISDMQLKGKAKLSFRRLVAIGLTWPIWLTGHLLGYGKCCRKVLRGKGPEKAAKENELTKRLENRGF